MAGTAGGNPTLYDVAQAAGVSLATASRALNGSARKVNDSYRDRVLAAAERLDYTPNLSAQAVAKGASNTVALLVSDIVDPYFSSIAAGVMREEAAAGLSVTMAVTDRDPEREIELVRVMRGQRPQVIVLAGSHLVDDPGRDALVAELDAFSSAGRRVVVISQKQLPFDTVLIDNRAGAEELARSLVGLGYRSFGILAGPTNLMTARDRDDAFRTELRLAGIYVDDAAIVHGGFTRDGGYAAIGELADSGALDRLEVVFAVNDVIAIGAMARPRPPPCTCHSRRPTRSRWRWHSRRGPARPARPGIRGDGSCRLARLERQQLRPRLTTDEERPLLHRRQVARTHHSSCPPVATHPVDSAACVDAVRQISPRRTSPCPILL